MDDNIFLELIKQSSEYKNFEYKVEEFNDELTILEDYINSASDENFSKELLNQLSYIRNDLEEEKTKFKNFLDEQYSLYLKGILK